MVPRDCVEAPTEDAQEASLRYMEEIYKAEVTSSEALIGGGLLGGVRN
jgi:hypothetical protein